MLPVFSTPGVIPSYRSTLGRAKVQHNSYILQAFAWSAAAASWASVPGTPLEPWHHLWFRVCCRQLGGHDVTHLSCCSNKALFYSVFSSSIMLQTTFAQSAWLKNTSTYHKDLQCLCILLYHCCCSHKGIWSTMLTRLKQTNEERGFLSAKQKIAATVALNLSKLLHGICSGFC